jgi:SAM-dependent methyltransferase
MRTTSFAQQQEAQDLAVTLRNRNRLGANQNLLFWYRQVYCDQFAGLHDPAALSILEIGSGTSPLKQFLPNVITSDVLELDYVDLVFDCHQIGNMRAIREESCDVITLTNVLHHLRNPIAFLNNAASKLKSGGRIIATEPFLSFLSTPIFKYLHPEPVEFKTAEPELENVRGPLASANIALPWLIFFRQRDWLARLNDKYDVAKLQIRPFSALSYMATGGISHQFSVPGWLYRALFPLDLFFSRRFPRVCASFFTVILPRR